ncbi:MAG: cobalamin biosynthesis protein [Alteromonadaceae bacterium]|nr:MAG: cobalamin biosynthesis protein [Alteromonadaceae bacterium]
MILISVMLALALDKLFSEPKHYHPLVYFGQWANFIEGKFNSDTAKRRHGIIAVLLVITPVLFTAVLLAYLSQLNSVLTVLVSASVLYVAIGWQSLIVHAQNIISPLKEGNIEQARKAIAMIVSRDTSELSDKEIAKAATESVLENGADAIFSAIFWFCIAGIPGVVLYRLANTLDAMWGYKNQRFLHFGWCAARLDDVLNYLPARLSAFSYAAAGHFNLALHYWREQGGNWKSPNAGPVMAAGAGALNVSLGGAASYHGKVQLRPVLGPEENEDTIADYRSIEKACNLINIALLCWVLSIALIWAGRLA